MPIPAQQVGQTIPKPDTLQFEENRIQGVTLIIPAGAGVTTTTGNRIVSLQEDAAGNRYAVLSPVAYVGAYETYTIIGWGVLENSLQSGNNSSVAQTPNVYVDGDTVTVLRQLSVTYMIDCDPAHIPTVGIATAYIDQQGRLTSVSTGSNLKTAGTVFKSVPGLQMSNQLGTNMLYYQLKDAVTP